jgi:Flp pilus assembly protein TadD
VEVARKIAGATGPFAGWMDAITNYRGLVALDPENPLLNIRLADALLRSGQPEPSLVFFARVVKAGPVTADAHVGYATALAQLNRFKEARRALEAGLLVDAANGQLHYNLGEIARAEGRADDARREYESALHDPVTAERARARLSESR